MVEELMAWHYTVGTSAARILAGGYILPATEYVPAGEKPIVWFSTRQDWEPTATKGYVASHALSMDQIEAIRRGLRRDATMAEMMDEGGVWRFGIASAELLPWGRLKETARIRRKMLSALLSTAQEKGADPYQWYGSLEPVAVSRCVIECRMTEADVWGKAPP